MSINKFFAALGAPVRNERWSWGARQPSDGVVFLRGWEDRIEKFDGRPHMLIDHHAGEPLKGRSHGYRERRRHIEAVRGGARCFVVVCTADDVDARPRKIAAFNTETLLEGGKVLDRDGSTWIEIVRTLPVSAVKSEA